MLDNVRHERARVLFKAMGLAVRGEHACVRCHTASQAMRARAMACRVAKAAKLRSAVSWRRMGRASWILRVGDAGWITFVVHGDPYAAVCNPLFDMPEPA